MAKRQPSAKKTNLFATSNPPFETRKLREGLRQFLSLPFEASPGKSMRVGGYQFGVYAFYDYDGEPIYVGQTCEKLSSRISRHLTNQRTDAVAMSVLDPFEVFEIEVWPLPDLEGRSCSEPQAKDALNELEAAVFAHALKHSRFNAVLNEKEPEARGKSALPKSLRGRIVDEEVAAIRNHPDTRLARRAATLARLAQVISEREVQVGLRKTLLTQAKRLQWLAQQRYDSLAQDETRKDLD